MHKARKPDIVCIGAQKAGTSWLHVTLATRPDIWVPPFKEMHFFDHKFIAECRRWAPWHVRQGVQAARERYLARSGPPDETYLNYLDRLQTPPLLNAIWYKYTFSLAGEGQKCLDVTPEYSCISEAGVDFFRRFLPNSQLIYIIRNPLDRLKSQMRMNAQREKNLPSSVQEWEELLQMPALQMRGDYSNNVPRWDARFMPERLMYLPFGQIRKDPMGVLRKIESHCNLPPFEYPRAAEKVHQTEPLGLPDHVVARLEEMAAPQNEFLVKRFGEAFFRET